VARSADIGPRPESGSSSSPGRTRCSTRAASRPAAAGDDDLRGRRGGGQAGADEDTLGDEVLGTVGALVAGLVLARRPATRVGPPPTTGWTADGTTT
jgi:hypothetical protein